MVVFLVCHSVKLIINGYECYELVKRNMADTDELEEEVEIPPRLSMEAQNQTEPEEESLPRYYPNSDS